MHILIGLSANRRFIMKLTAARQLHGLLSLSEEVNKNILKEE
jgi:hypothetical protein